MKFQSCHRDSLHGYVFSPQIDCPKPFPSELKFLDKSVEVEFHKDKKISGRKAYSYGKKSPIYKHSNGLSPHLSILFETLKECNSSRTFPTGKKLHAAVADSMNTTNIIVTNMLIYMYAKCGSRRDAFLVFNTIPYQNVVSWNALIAGYRESGDCTVSLQLFARMQDEGFTPDAQTYVAALKACADCAAKEVGKEIEGKLVKIQSLKKGRAIHLQLAKSGHELHMFVATTLLDMYAKCGSMFHACAVFDKMPYHNVVSWSAMMFGYVESGEGKLALELFKRMQDEGCRPNGLTYTAALKAIASCAPKEDSMHMDRKLAGIECLEKGISFHSELTKGGHEFNPFVVSSLVDMYAKCGSMVHARRVFDRMPHRGLLPWTSMIFGYINSGESKLGLQLFACMQDEVTPDARTFVAALKACASCAAKEESKIVWLKKGLAIHLQLTNCGYESDVFVATTLINMYAKCGSMAHAHLVFEKMLNRNAASWSAMMFGYAECGEEELALNLFVRMQDEGFTPDVPTYVAALKACASCAVTEKGKQVERNFVKIGSIEKGIAIHSQLGKCGDELNIFIATSLVDMYAKCGSMLHAMQLFHTMSYHDVVSWNAVIFGYGESGESNLAFLLFVEMQDEGFLPDDETYVAVLKACALSAEKEESTRIQGMHVKINCLEKVIAIHSPLAKNGHELEIVVANTLVDTYAKCGSMTHACCVFNRMCDHDIVSWNTLVSGHAECGNSELSLQLFLQLQDEGFTPDACSYVAVLKACSTLASLELGKKIHFQICQAGLQSDPVVAKCLVGFYGKCGSMMDAEQIFHSMEKKDLMAWNSLVTGYAHKGDSKNVFDLFRKMEDQCVQPDGITFVSVISVCSHAGVIAKGKYYFQYMCLCYLIPPAIEHYACIVDLLGRSNCLADAVAVVKSMPFQPNITIWKTVLSACSKWKNLVVGRLAFEALISLDNKDASTYMLMTSIYKDSGDLEAFSKVSAI